MKKISALLLALFALPAFAQTTGGGVNPNPDFTSVNVNTTGGSVDHTAGRLTTNRDIRQLSTTDNNIFFSLSTFKSAQAIDINRAGGSYIDFNASAPGEYGLIGLSSIASGGSIADNSFGIFGGPGSLGDVVLGSYSGGFAREVLRVVKSTRTMTCQSDSLGHCQLYGAATNDLWLGANLQKVMVLTAVSGHNEVDFFTDSSAADLGRIVDSTRAGGTAGHLLLEGTNAVDIGTPAGSNNPQIVLGTTSLTYKLGRFNIGTANNTATIMVIDSAATANEQKFRIKSAAGLKSLSACNDAESTCSDAFSFTSDSSGNVDNIAIKANAASSTLDVRADTMSFFDHSGGNTASVQVNSSDVCTQATGCTTTGALKTAYLRATGTACTVSDSAHISSCTHSSTGIYAVVFDGGFFSNTPICQATSTSAAGAFAAFATAFSVSSSGITVQDIDFNGATIDGGFNLTCIGT